MKFLISLIPLTTLVASSAIQQPLHEASNFQAPLTSKPLVSSTALQDHIASDNLLKRAKKLFEIAQLGVAEYNHPTRVIGSDGM
jgi:aminopeptidase Y